MPLRLVFMGTPDFAVPTLLEIVGAGHEIVAVYTRAPQPAGRGMELRPSPIARQAERFGLPVFSPKTLKGSEAEAAIRAHGADAAVVVAYGLILPKPILDAFPLGCFNLHASLLPRWRGAAPIQRAIIAGDRETGVMVMKMEEGLDTGPVAMAERVAIGPEATAGEMHDKLARLGADLMLRALAALEKGALQFTPQGDARRDLRQQDRQERDADRLEPSRGSGSMTIAAACRRFPAPGSSLPAAAAPAVSKCCARRRATARQARSSARRTVDHRLRRGRGAPDRIAARRPPADAGGRRFLRGTPIGRECVLA